jgi:hypothetical protein
MFKSSLLVFLLIISVLSASTPCVQYKGTTYGTASDCSMIRVDKYTITWGAVINFDDKF